MARFRLERLLRLRSQLRTLKGVELQQVEHQLEQLRGARRALEDERWTVLEESLRATEEACVDGATVRIARAYAAALGERGVELDGRVVEEGRRAAAKRAELGTERREERKLEHLADRHHEQLEVEAALAAEHQLDELVLARHARELAEGRRG